MDDERELVDVRLDDISLDSYGCDINWTLAHAADWVAGLLAKVPEEFHAASYFRVHRERDYEGGHYVNLLIGYERPITDEEIAERHREQEEEDARYATEREASERAEFERLAAKFARDRD